MNDKYARHLSGMVRFPTVSSTDTSLTDYSVFDKFREYLEDAYPLVHRTLERTKIARASLLYRWKSEAPKKKPLLLMAHQDVVPAGDPGSWKYPPFSGEIAEGFVWGRGSSDCKSVLMAELEAVEELIGSGFRPDFDIYLAFGENEEVQVPLSEKGAARTVEYLASNSVRLGAVFDEGGTIRCGRETGSEVYICEICLAEKGFQDYEIYCETEGGHSMAPGAGTAVGAVARAVVEIEAHPFPYRLTDTVKRTLKATSTCLEGDRKRIFSDPEFYWEELTELAGKDKDLDALLHTTAAATMSYGSLQSNILPERAGVIVNCRLLEGDTSEKLLERFRAFAPDGVKVKFIAGEEPGPSTPADGECFRLVERVLKGLYGDKAVIVPTLLKGGTDSRFYYPVCENIFRFSGFLNDPRWGKPHRANERVPVDALDSGVRFYTELLRSY